MIGLDRTVDIDRETKTLPAAHLHNNTLLGRVVALIILCLHRKLWVDTKGLGCTQDSNYPMDINL